MHLEEARIVSIGERVPQGSTYPIYALVKHSRGEIFDVICKFAVSEKRIPPESALNEWVATSLAGRVGIPVAPCYLVKASDGICDYVRDRFGITVASPYGFATKVSTIDPLVYDASLRALPERDLVTLYLFDLIMLNSDRSRENPNCGQANRRLFAYDFGSALISPQTKPSSFEKQFFPPNIVDRSRSHLCEPFLGSVKETIRILNEIIDKITEARTPLAGLVNQLSPPLDVHLRLILEYLEYLGKERALIVRQVFGTVVPSL